MSDVTYTSYLKLDQVLTLQEPLSENEHDEMLFIVIHQVYELWFKQVLHEFSLMSESLRKGDTFQIMATSKRCLTILKTMVSQNDILETMTPMSFNAFRDRLSTSSGFQSVQFRKFEFLMGNKRREMIEIHKEFPDRVKELEKYFVLPTLVDDFYAYVKTQGYDVPDSLLNRDVTTTPTASEEGQNLLVEIYKKDPLNVQICETLIDLDEGVQEWRYRHVKMVERTIGTKPGTGGSMGVEFLKKSLFKPTFVDLWETRSQF